MSIRVDPPSVTSSLTSQPSTFKDLKEINEGRGKTGASTNRSTPTLGDKALRRMSYGATNSITTSNDDPDQTQALREHLERSAPFNGKWTILEFLSSGAYGSVIAVEEKRKDGTVQEAVLKVSKGETANKQAEWEALILRRIQRNNEKASVVRVLDSGTLASHDDDHLKFLAVERCELEIGQYVQRTKGAERQSKVCHIALGLLKSLFDIHCQGILHRDVKSKNAGLVIDKDATVKVLLYDFGNARLYTDDEGNVLPPRTTTWYRGSREFSSSWADDMREQTRWDDLISWFYVAIDLMNPDDANDSPLPWSYANAIQHRRAMTFLKGAFMPAKVTLRHCPAPFYAINSYLQTTARNRVPDYAWLAKKMREAKDYPCPQ